MMVATDADRQKVKEYLTEAMKAMDRLAEEQEHVSDILNTLKSDHDIPPKISRKIISAMRKGNMPEIKEENDMVEDLFEIVS